MNLFYMNILDSVLLIGPFLYICHPLIILYQKLKQWD